MMGFYMNDLITDLQYGRPRKLSIEDINHLNDIYRYVSKKINPESLHAYDPELIYRL